MGSSQPTGIGPPFLIRNFLTTNRLRDSERSLGRFFGPNTKVNEGRIAFPGFLGNPDAHRFVVAGSSARRVDTACARTNSAVALEQTRSGPPQRSVPDGAAGPIGRG